MSGIETALAIGALATSTVSAVASGVAANKNAKFQATLAEQNAETARQRAAAEESKYRAQATKLLGRQRTLFAGSGVSLEGSPLLAQEEAAAGAELEALTIRHSGDLASAAQRNQAVLQRLSGRNALTQSYLSAGSTLMSGASKFNYD